MSTDEPTPKPISPTSLILRQLAAGGIACMIGSAILNPMDVIKVRLQTQGQLSMGGKTYTGFMDCARTIVRQEGALALGKGMSASMLREATYSSLRMGLYRPVRDLIAPPDQDAGLGRKILAGLTTGAIGSCIANPTDVIKIRMQVQGPLQPGESPRYKGMIDAFIKIYREEGVVRGYYRGVSATAVRAACLTSAQMSSYDHSKFLLLNHTDGAFKNDFTTHLICSLISGFVTACVTSPVGLFVLFLFTSLFMLLRRFMSPSHH
eukprot:TRINITY_DN6944_c0_g1_i1.p1 TRINITY_DN6944_c0_g1~~TRINITY_DN6944_c0_g1_i1.p1  ORF type:complete len:290 (-),score=48.79 TRINITY_DN6944_c0_g1_i1:220-1011(-)